LRRIQYMAEDFLGHRSNKIIPSFMRIYHKVARKIQLLNSQHSFAQCGEDLIINFICSNLFKMNNPSYLDIGAHHPTSLSNTYLFYVMGCRGVCVEPDPFLFQAIRKKRAEDICLNAGVGALAREYADFYIMSSRILNTFSKEEAIRYQGYGNKKIERIIQLPLLSINDICRQYFPSHPNFISLDVEGSEMSILNSFNFSLYRPEIFCIETITYTENKTERKIVEIIDFMKAAGYFVYADTYINTIFIDTNAWRDLRK
jgi:FkbM family methyltransferase